MIIIKNGMGDVSISSDPLPFLPLFVNILGNHFPPVTSYLNDPLTAKITCEKES